MDRIKLYRPFLKAVYNSWLSVIVYIIMIISLSSCGGSKAQFFVFPENRLIYHKVNIIHEIFPGWEMDISLMSPQGDHWANDCAHCSDFSYHVTIHNLFPEDSNSVWNVYDRFGRPLRKTTVPNRIYVDSIFITILQSDNRKSLGLDYEYMKEWEEYYEDGLHYRFKKFSIPRKCDSLRLEFTAIKTDNKGVPIDTAVVDTILYRWIRPKKE